MPFRVISLCVLVLATASCGGSKVAVQDTWREKQEDTDISSGKSLVVVNTLPAPGNGLVECVELALYKRDRDLVVIPSDEFRDSMFPWFEPGIAPESAQELEELMGRSVVKTRLDELKLRYLVTLSGESITRPGSWGGCAGGYAGAACVGGLSSDKEINLTASILDLESLEDVAQFEAKGSGKSEVGMIVIIPYFVASSAESDTCSALAERIVAFLRGA